MINILLLNFYFLFDYLISQRFREVFSLGVTVEHVWETSFHLCLNLKRLSLNILHLLLDDADTLLQKGWVQNPIILKHSTGIAAKATTGWLTWLQSAGLHGHDSLEFVNFLFEVSTARFCVLIEKLHIIELLIDWDHHLEHHLAIVIKNVLLNCSTRSCACLRLVHDVVDDFAHLFLIFLKHLNLWLHELGLAVH